MVRVIYRVPGGEPIVTEAREGASAMESAVENAVPGIVGECGGSMACGTCHVYVAEEWIGRTGPFAVGSDEEAMLEGTFAPPTDVSRLSCQIKLGPELDGLVVDIPNEQL